MSTLAKMVDPSSLKPFEAQSKAAWLASQPKEKQSEFLKGLTEEELTYLLWDWSFWARPNQRVPEGSWETWLLMAGRGFGKTRTGAEYIRKRVEEGAGRVAFVARTPADARDVMVEGESGILTISPSWNKPIYEPSKRRLTWPNGAMALIYSSQEPEQLRGPQFECAWADEVRTWFYPQETWDNLKFAVRLGKAPQVVATTTPKPIALIRELLKDPTVVKTFGTTYENFANLSEVFIKTVLKKYEGTTLGLQEIYAKMLAEVPGALWKREIIERNRVQKFPEMVRVIVGVDPEVASNEDSAETGVVVAGKGTDGLGYVLGDVSIRGTPHVWGSRVVTAYRSFKAHKIIAEKNNGGEMVEFTIRTVDPHVNCEIIHASQSKQARAEPIAALYEQNRIKHVGTFSDLEDQLCTWVPGSEKSPDRLDALVWAMTELDIAVGYLDFKESDLEDLIGPASRSYDEV